LEIRPGRAVGAAKAYDVGTDAVRWRAWTAAGVYVWVSENEARILNGQAFGDRDVPSERDYKIPSSYVA